MKALLANHAKCHKKRRGDVDRWVEASATLSPISNRRHLLIDLPLFIFFVATLLRVEQIHPTPWIVAGFFFEALLLDVVWMAIGAMVGDRKGRSAVGGALGLFLGAVGVCVALAMRGDRRECPSCSSLVRESALICPFCEDPQPEAERTDG